jgi:hypothetical protein
MTPEQRAEVRRARAADQAERDAKALAHAKAHPKTAEEQAELERLRSWLSELG